MNSPPTYCYWSVATGPYAELMERCVASARAAGVFKEFHVLTDRPIQGAESYEAYEVELTDKLFKLVYLKAAISKLNFDYYVWVDADTMFRRNPRNLLSCLGRSPIHVPLEINLSAFIVEADGCRSQNGGAASAAPATGRPDAGQNSWATGMSPFRYRADVDAPQPGLYGLSMRDYAQLFVAAGVNNPVYWSRSAFWIVRRTAIERVCELALHFRAFAKERGITVDATAGLSYAMQMLCADPAKHELAARHDLWSSACMGVLVAPAPAIVHTSFSTQLAKVAAVETETMIPHELVSTT